MIDLLRHHDMSHPVDTLPPKVAVVIVYHREPDHQHLLDAMESVALQSYPNCHCITVDNRTAGLTLGAARNLAIEHTDADFILPLAEDDRLELDTVASLIAFHQHYRKELPQLRHTTTACTVLMPNGTIGVANGLLAPGMYLREHLVSNPFDKELSQAVDTAALRLLHIMAGALGGPTSITIGHHFGYQLRDTPFRRDGVQVKR